MRILYVRPSSTEAVVMTNAFVIHEVLFTDSLRSVDPLVLQSIEVLSVFVDTPVDEAILAACPNLKHIATRSVGFDHINVQAAHAKNITVSRVPHYGSQTVAEYVFALMFALSRNAFGAYTDMMQTASITNLLPYEGFDLAGKTLGVVGTGKIGQRVCAIAKSFGMEVVAYDQYPNEAVTAIGIPYVELDALMQKSDMVTLHVPGRPETYHMIDARLLSLMKPKACLINTARGEVVDTRALVEALRSKQIAGAGLDVLEKEHELATESELTDVQKADMGLMELLALNHELIAMPNVIVTPHIAFNTSEAKDEIVHITLTNIQGYIHGDAVNLVSL